MFTVEFNAKDVHPWIQERLEESVTTHTRVGVNSLKGQPAENTDRSQLYIEIYSRKSFFYFSVILLNIDNVLLTFRLKWIDLDPDLHHAGKYKCIQGSLAQPHAYTLPDLAYKKVCVCEKRFFFFCTWCRHRHTNTQQVQCWVKLWRAKPKNNETRKVSPCQTATVLLKFIVSYINNATLFHSNCFFFFLLKKR